MKEFDWNLIKSFVAVAETGSFTGTARALHLSQSAISHAIKTLEDDAREEGDVTREAHGGVEVGGGRVEAGARLVQDDDPRIADHRPRDSQPLSLSAR